MTMSIFVISVRQSPWVQLSLDIVSLMLTSICSSWWWWSSHLTKEVILDSIQIERREMDRKKVCIALANMTTVTLLFSVNTILKIHLLLQATLSNVIIIYNDLNSLKSLITCFFITCFFDLESLGLEVTMTCPCISWFTQVCLSH